MQASLRNDDNSRSSAATPPAALAYRFGLTPNLRATVAGLNFDFQTSSFNDLYRRPLARSAIAKTLTSKRKVIRAALRSA